jgi:hypothetical protein
MERKKIESHAKKLKWRALRSIYTDPERFFWTI